MNDLPYAAPTQASHAHPQAELPGIPRGSSLHEILTGYGLTPSEASGGMRRYRHDLACNHLRATAEFWLTSDGEVESFRIWSQRPRKQRAGVAQPAS